MRMEEILIAPCGANCAVCMAYLAMKHDLKKKGIRAMYCRGCLPRGKKGCTHQHFCEKMQTFSIRFCWECENFPCEKIKQGDKKIMEKQHWSLIENAEYIKKHGMEKFLKKEEERWRCPECGGTISRHNGICYTCGLEELRYRHNRYKSNVLPRKGPFIERGKKMKAELIAPCGKNCNSCLTVLKKNPCSGCVNRDLKCKIKNCETIKTNKSGFCYECAEFPCRRIKYHEKTAESAGGYISLIENLNYIKTNGMKTFLAKEERKFKCPECGRFTNYNGNCHYCANKIENKNYIKTT